MDEDLYQFYRAASDVYRTALNIVLGWFVAWRYDGFWNSLFICVVFAVVLNASLAGISIGLGKWREGKLRKA